jgi:hypothetical protein
MANYDYSNISKYLKDRVSKAPQQKINTLAQNILMYWNQLVAQRVPKEQQAEYKRCMVVRISNNHIYIYLDTSLSPVGGRVKDLERGKPTWIMNPVLLKNATKRSDKSGKYADIPMVRSKEEILSRGGEPAMAAVNRLRYASKWQWKEDNKFKLKPGWAHPIHDNVRNVRVNGSTIAVPAHATDPLAGLYKVKRGGKAQYVNFRRITENGKHWIGKSVQARRLLRKVRNRLEALGKEVFDGV